LRGAESIRMIYRARAGAFFCIFFVFLARVSSGFEKYVVGLWYNFAEFFSKFRLELGSNSISISVKLDHFL